MWKWTGEIYLLLNQYDMGKYLGCHELNPSSVTMAQKCKFVENSCYIVSNHV